MWRKLQSDKSKARAKQRSTGDRHANIRNKTPGSLGMAAEPAGSILQVGVAKNHGPNMIIPDSRSHYTDTHKKDSQFAESAI